MNSRFAPIAVCMVPILLASVARADLPVFRLAALPEADLDPAASWSAAQTEGAVSYRAALPGRLARFRVPAWWDAQSLRPPEGTIYVLEVTYKDTVDTPVIFTTYGAAALYFDQGEAHRFGGAADGRWKTASIPVAWDCLARVVNTVNPAEDHAAQTAFGVKAATNLPIASVRVRLSTPADEARFNEETRAWVVAVQAGKRSPGPAAPKARQFLAGKQLPPVVAFAWPPLALLLPNAQPKDEQVGAPIRLRMCRNEFETGSFGVYANGTNLTKVDYAVSELKTDAGVALKAEIVRRTAEYALIPRKKTLHLMPQRFWPAYPADVPEGQSQWFCFDVRTRRGESQPGVYKGMVTVTSAAGKAELPVEIEVLPIDLLTMDEAGLCLGGCTQGVVPAHDVAFQVDYNQNAVNLWFASCKPKMALRDGGLALDFTYMDDWLVRARQHGMTKVVYFLGGDPYGFPYTMSLPRELYGLLHPGSDSSKEFAKAQSASPDTMLAEVRPLYEDFIRQLYVHAGQAGWPELIVTPFDEPAKWVQKQRQNAKEGMLGSGPWIKTYFKDACVAIRAAAPKARIYGSIHHLNRSGQQDGMVFLEDVDVFCTNAIHEDPAVGDKVRAAGKTFWQYGGGPAPDSAAFQYGFFFAAFDSRGGLCWAYNWGPGFDLSDGESWVYAWQTPYTTIPAPYFIGVREGLDARRLVETCRRTLAGNAAATKVVDDVLQEVRNSRAAGGRDTVNDFWAAVDDVHKLDVWRNRLLDLLAQKK